MVKIRGKLVSFARDLGESHSEKSQINAAVLLDDLEYPREIGSKICGRIEKASTVFA